MPQNTAAGIVAINEPINGKLLGGITGKGFLPGVSGNPSGRPKRKPFTRALELVLRTRIPADETGKLKKFAGRKLITAAAAGILRRAAEGDPAAFKEARLAVQGPDVDDDDSKGAPVIVVNMISIAGAGGKTN